MASSGGSGWRTARGLRLGDDTPGGEHPGGREGHAAGTASSACGLYGYPGASFVTSGDGAARQIGAAAQQDPGFGKAAVRLPAGGMAHPWLQVSQAGSYPSAMCQPVTAHWLRIYAPGETQALYVNQSFGIRWQRGLRRRM